LGTVPASGSGWTVAALVDPVTGQLGITLSSLTPITTTVAAWSLVTIAFHWTGAPLHGTSAIQLARCGKPQ